MADTWLSFLITATPQEGFELAITLSRRGVKDTQPDIEVLHKLRPGYVNDADSLTDASQVIAINFQTIATVNDYWKIKNTASHESFFSKKEIYSLTKE
ncbi:MAG: hexameric tyrosine-coordinated heme protein [Ginsengibacter sp.]